MQDKDKLFLLFNVYVAGMHEPTITDALTGFGDRVAKMFDDSVKVFIHPTRDENKSPIEVITNMKAEWNDLILEMEKYLKDGNDEELKTQAKLLCDLVKETNK